MDKSGNNCENAITVDYENNDNSNQISIQHAKHLINILL